MKKILLLTLVLSLLLLGSSFASAYHATVYSGPSFPYVDNHVRLGGPFPSASYYKVGLREGIVTHPHLDVRARTYLSSRYYPRQSIYSRSPYFGSTYGGSHYRFNPYGSRVGGYYGSGYGFRGVMPGNFVFS